MDKDVFYMGKIVTDLTKDELIEALMFIVPKYQELEKNNFDLQKKSFCLELDNIKLNRTHVLPK